MKSAAAFLLVLGLAQMAADVLGLASVRGLAAAMTASPAPKVFSAVEGLETYSSRFFVSWQDRAGASQTLELTPDTYKPLRGPYNRRNAYGAVFAYGPVLAANPATRPMFESVARYALCNDATLLSELGAATEEIAGDVRVRIVPLPGSDTGALPLVIEAPCE